MNTSPKRVYALIASVLVIVVLGFFYVRAVPVRLIGLNVFEGDYVQGKVLSFGIFGLNEKKVAVDGVLADYASAHGTSVAIVRNANTSAADIMMLGSKPRPLTADGEGKAAVAVSPDGDMVAYAALMNAPEGTHFTPQLSAWNIKVINIKTGEVTLMDKGFAPEFFKANDKLMLLFTGPTGITVADVAAKTAQTTFFLNPGVIDYAAHISMDGKYIAIPNGLTKHYDMFSVTKLEAPIGLAPLGSLEPILIHGAFKGDAFYGVERVADGAPHLWKFNTANPPVGTQVFSLPTPSIYRIIH